MMLLALTTLVVTVLFASVMEGCVTVGSTTPGAFLTDVDKAELTAYYEDQLISSLMVVRQANSAGGQVDFDLRS